MDGKPRARAGLPASAVAQRLWQTGAKDEAAVAALVDSGSSDGGAFLAAEALCLSAATLPAARALAAAAVAAPGAAAALGAPSAPAPAAVEQRLRLLHLTDVCDTLVACLLYTSPSPRD